MRFRHPDGSLVHLAYCTNVHPAEDLDGVIGQLGRYARPARERLGVPLLGVGLWLARGVADVLVADPARLARLRAALDRHGLEVVTLNGFPYQGFQAEVVKHRVYHPDWTEPARLRYTLDLARILAGLLPDDVAEGSVSTLPLAWRHPWTEGQAATAARHRALLAEGLAELAAETGKTIRVGFEPEPGCVVETTAQAAAQGLGVCLDACHLAVAFEDPAAAVARLGPSIVKLQASAALHADRPADPATRRALASFAEPRFLHQTREAGHLHGTDDLDAALDGWLPGDAAWRVHFHVPLHAPPAPPLRSTGPVLEEVLAVLFGGDRALTRHIEVETYTWEVLPDPPRTPGALADGIAAELAWTRDRLIDLGLKEEHPA
ncbi:metabolite traffic protein EboE [Actinomadura macrotermitis]|uniref:Xylose isomerase-like TIM barrel domain-containing protein n=1 Tax=Actinomadura macrotermitis TaxID=2585200 RepID=A0A7K0BXR7_9ACTN|nr:hypothetical protein [Actinomadura macrotermitis]